MTAATRRIRNLREASAEREHATGSRIHRGGSRGCLSFDTVIALIELGGHEVVGAPGIAALEDIRSRAYRLGLKRGTGPRRRHLAWYHAAKIGFKIDQVDDLTVGAALELTAVEPPIEAESLTRTGDRITATEQHTQGLTTGGDGGIDVALRSSTSQR